ncbi:hypothetical protein [Halalkalibacter oceani]|uniref:hypothetical protein n=1 Tax=Halalkalibacter oceani TaxID=1653776 RepID=UPI003391C0A3
MAPRVARLATRNPLVARLSKSGNGYAHYEKAVEKVKIVLFQQLHPYTEADVAEARKVLTGLFPSIENNYAKSRVGSPQRTLLARRLKAMKVAVQAIDDELSNKELKDNL